VSRRRGAVLALLLALLPGAAAAGWDRFEIILWHDHGPAALAGARRLGVTAGMLLGLRGPVDAARLRARAAALRAVGLGCYVENIATDFYAAYHRWQPGRPVSWQFDQVRALHRRDPADPAAWVRVPSLSDPVWLARIAARLRAHVAALAAFRPLYYSLGDETGIADLSAAWDFDQSPASLAGFRTWLRGQYGALATLNAEWGSHFARWDDVAPMLTDAAIARHDDNFAAWSDFKAWMDTAFAQALAAGTAAVHAADPAARAGIEGAQIPGWGGYDYTRLAFAVDIMEIYDFAENIAIAAALNPDLVLLIASAGDTTPAARHLLWQAALRGVRGLILWDPKGRIIGADGTPGPRGIALAPVLAALRGAAGTRLVASRAISGPVGILYSPASERMSWLLDRRAEAARGLPGWTTRDAAAELADTAPRAARRQAAQALAHRAVTPRWLTPATLAAGRLRASGLKVLLLPQALALSDAEVVAIRAFAAEGGMVLADAPPGAFDAHGRRRPAPPLDDAVRPLRRFDAAALDAALNDAGVAAPFTLTRPDGTAVRDVAIRLRRDGATMLLGLLRDLPEAGAAPAEDVVLTLPQPLLVRDLLADAPPHRTARLVLRLDPATPALLALMSDDGVRQER
jgi:hypothetical protein